MPARVSALLAATSFRLPDWYGDWIRWRGLDLGYADTVANALKLDIVYTWVNGSDPALRRLKKEYQMKSPLFAQAGVGDEKAIAAATTKRFRDMDELRYSVRSVAEYARHMFRHVHVLMTEVDHERHVQVPAWLDLTGNIVQSVPHRTTFRNSSHLPSFNCLAIESQMHHIPGLTDVFVYMNDDFFLGTKLLPSDFWTALYGFVFHMEGGLRVPPVIRPTEKNPVNIGEWSSLQYTNFLLSQRFGPRYRAYLAHIPHVLSVPILNEIEDLWPQDVESTASHRFKGEGDAKDIHVTFFMAHFVMERLRETQLESYWLHRLDANHDGTLDWKEREKLILLIQSWNSNQQQEAHLRQKHSRPAMIAGYDGVFRRAGVPWSGSTVYRLAGIDGYPFLIKNADTSKTIPLVPTLNEKGGQQPPQIPYMNYESPETRTCQLDLAFCLGHEFVDPNHPALTKNETQKIFRRLAFEEFHCGDCLLQVLTQHPDAGVSAWMPQNEHSEAFQDVAQKMARYNYVLGTSDYTFTTLQGVEGAKKNLGKLLEEKEKKAFFCINDDYPDDEKLQTQMRAVVLEAGGWMDTTAAGHAKDSMNWQQPILDAARAGRVDRWIGLLGRWMDIHLSWEEQDT
ncbi:Xanthine phosphoribosyltransferase 1 [Mortierella alpina]|uniref:Xanthine phosphoribosyltransferase 1 n=1 Tax=Mortierella alpina TaxID=64518 RepID=A0A9P6J9X6_MORAP|nr:Xanthine phosphoribosyltransferase 1 [Mortierella alpina]